MAQTGQETIIVNGPITEIGFMAEKTKQINAATQKLTRQGKEIVNIIESMPTSVLGLKTQEIRIIWKIPDKPAASANHQSQAFDSQLSPAQKWGTVSVNSENYDSIVERIFMFLEDGEWERADYYCEQALNYNPKSGTLYLGKLMAELHVKKEFELQDVSEPFDENGNCIKAGQFDTSIAERLVAYNHSIREKNNAIKNENLYNKALSLMNSAKTEDDYKAASYSFNSIIGYKNAKELSQKCFEKAEVARKDEIYNRAIENISDKSISSNEEAIRLFESIIDWKDSRAKIDECNAKIEEIRIAEEKEESERKRKEQEARIATEKKKALCKKIVLIGGPIVAVLIIFLVVLNYFIIPSNKYKKAMKLADSGEYTQAISVLETLDDYKDAKTKITDIHLILADIAEKSGDIRTAVLEYDKAGKYKDSKEKESDLHYKLAVAAEKAGDIRTAALEYRKAGDYRDSKEKESDLHYKLAVAAEKAGDIKTAVLEYGKTGKDKNKRELILNFHQSLDNLISAGSGNYFTVGLRVDGTVVATGYNKEGQCDVDGWTDIVAVSAGTFHTVGLRADGTVVATGNDYYGKCNVDGWKDIVAVSAGQEHTVGLRADGTVVATGYNRNGECDVDGWTDIVAVSAGDYYTVGLRADGTVVATGSESFGKRDVEGWTDIVAISAGEVHTVGLRSDGTVVTAGSNDYGKRDVEGWTDIVDISAGDEYTIGLRVDGTVVSTEYSGKNDKGQCNVDGWTDIVAVSAGTNHTVGLRADGTVVATGDNEFSQCDVYDWKDMKLPNKNIK